MIYNVLIAILLIAFLVLVWYIIYASISSKRKEAQAKDQPQPERKPDPVESIGIKIRKDSEGVQIFIPGAVIEDSSDTDIFPDLFNDVAPDDQGLDEEFFKKVAMMPEIQDAESREKIAQELADKGYIPKDRVEEFARVTERNDTQESPTPEPVVDEGEGGHIQPEPEIGPVDPNEQLPPPEDVNRPIPTYIPADEPIPVPDAEPAAETDEFAEHEFHI